MNVTTEFRGSSILAQRSSIGYIDGMGKQQANTITAQLRIILDDCGLTRYEIAQRTGIDQSTLARFYNGQRGLSMAALDSLGVCLELTISLPKTPNLKDQQKWRALQKTKRRAT